jgi:hypothetical protein
MDSDLEVRRYITAAFRDNFDADQYSVKLRERIAIDAGQGLGWWIIRKRYQIDTFLGMTSWLRHRSSLLRDFICLQRASDQGNHCLH